MTAKCNLKSGVPDGRGQSARRGIGLALAFFAEASLSQCTVNATTANSREHNSISSSSSERSLFWERRCDILPPFLPFAVSSQSSRARRTSSTSTPRRSARGSRRRRPPSTSPSSTTPRADSTASSPSRGPRWARGTGEQRFLHRRMFNLRCNFRLLSTRPLRRT